MLFRWWCFFKKIGRTACCLWCGTISPYFVRVYDPDRQTPQMSEFQTLWQWQKNWRWVGSDTKLNFWVLCSVSIRKAMIKILSSLALIPFFSKYKYNKNIFVIMWNFYVFFIYFYIFLCVFIYVFMWKSHFFFLILCFWVKICALWEKLIVFQWKLLCFFGISYFFQFLPFMLLFEGSGIKFESRYTMIR